MIWSKGVEDSKIDASQLLFRKLKDLGRFSSG